MKFLPSNKNHWVQWIQTDTDTKEETCNKCVFAGENDKYNFSCKCPSEVSCETGFFVECEEP